MVGCLRRLRMFEVEGRGTKNAIVLHTILINTKLVLTENRSGRMEKALI